MGCDIHAHIEAQEYDSMRSYAKVSLSRNYLMFGMMAGVRKDCALFEPRGIPEDVCMITLFEYKKMEVDAHNPSWLTTNEFERVIMAYASDGSYGDVVPSIYRATLAMMKELGDTSRIVFWFDN